MSSSNDKWQVPYNHLAVLGMEKLKKYVPPSKDSSDDVSGPAKKNG